MKHYPEAVIKQATPAFPLKKGRAMTRPKALLAAALLMTQLRPAQTRAEDRKYLLETVDDAAVVQVYADAFKELPLEQKKLTWHLYQAAIAARDIYYDQRHAQALQMRDLVEAVVATPDAAQAPLIEANRLSLIYI